MPEKKLIYVKVVGTGILQTFQAKEHSLEARGNSTYHVFILPDNTTWYLNDYGIRSVYIADSLDKLN